MEFCGLTSVVTATASRLARTSDGLHVGSSGWSYPSWRPEFYPAGLASEEFLFCDAARLGSVELNSTGYRMPSEEHLRFREPPYADDELQALARMRPLLAGGADVFAYLRHEDAPTAPASAERLAALVGAVRAVCGYTRIVQFSERVPAVPSTSLTVRDPLVGRCTDMAAGTVKWFDDAKGYGFIAPEDGGKDLFVHHSGIEGDGFKTLAEGAKVEFEAREGQKGPEAFNVVAV